MYQWLTGAAENNSTIITASRRLARVLTAAYGKQRLAQGHRAWLSPDISFIDDWLVSLVNTTPEALPVLLSAHACNVVWERSLSQQAREPLLNVAALVRQARQSWERLHDWEVPLGEVSSSARSQDERLFAAAASRYQDMLDDRRWIDTARLKNCVTGLIEKKSIPVPSAIVYAGFDRLSPAVNHLFAALRGRGCDVSVAPPDKLCDDIEVSAFDDAEAELRAAGAWARRALDENPDLTIGIVSSSLDKNAAAIERLIREGVAPGWQYGPAGLRMAVNTSYGRRLSQYPAIAVALLLLKWTHRGLTFREVSVLLRSQFIAAQETSGRCRMETYLRRQPDRSWSPSAIVRLLKSRGQEGDAAKWLDCVEHLSNFRKGIGEKVNPSVWADRIDGLLRELGWPGSATLSSDEFQLLNRWRDLLNDLARLEIVCPDMTFAEASRRLNALANDTIYQPESRTGIVQLLGPLEAAGMRFDHIWVSGLEADNWPPAAHPLTLVSRQLQRRHSMPDSTPDDTLEYSRRVLNRLASSADRVRLSWPKSSEEFENSASPLIARYAATATGEAMDPGWHAINLIGSHRVEQASEDPVPAVKKNEVVAGGAYTVQRQLTEPFSAFAHGRLRVSELEKVATGLSPSQRGSLIHNVLHELYRDRPSQDLIRSWSKAEVRKRIDDAVDSSLKEYAWHADAVLQRMLALERDRLRDLVETFVAEELTRQTFAIESVEEQLDFERSGVRLKLRIDRVDRLSDGSLLIADYKTGQRRNLLNRHGDPHEIQLVVYACALEKPIGGLVLINIDSRSINYNGASASGEWDPKRADQWSERLAAWQETVTTAMRQIAKGDVRINPVLPKDKTRPLNILSRFEEHLRADR